MIGGILKKDLQLPMTANLWWEYLDDDDFVLTPLPNHLFQRDNTAFAYAGLSVHPMAKPARKRETVHSRVVWNFHPEFKDSVGTFYYGNDDEPHDPATIEGGDIAIVGNGTVMIGMGERSTPQGIGMLTQAYFSAPAQQIDKVIVVELPRDAQPDAPGHRDDDDRQGHVLGLLGASRGPQDLHVDEGR